MCRCTRQQSEYNVPGLGSLGSFPSGLSSFFLTASRVPRKNRRLLQRGVGDPDRLVKSNGKEGGDIRKVSQNNTFTTRHTFKTKQSYCSYLLRGRLERMTIILHWVHRTLQGLKFFGTRDHQRILQKQLTDIGDRVQQLQLLLQPFD